MWIEKSVLDELVNLGREIDSDLAGEVIGLFESDGEENLRELLQNIDSNQIEMAGRMAHKLKSTCANVGAIEASSICKNIEEICKNQKGLENLGKEKEKIIQAFAESKHELLEFKSHIN